VSISNSILVLSSPDPTSSDVGESVVVRDELHEIMELAPTVPKLDRLHAMLRGCEYREDEEEVNDEPMDEDGDDSGEAKCTRYTYEDIREAIQASDAELNKIIRESYILRINGYLRPLPLPSLTHILVLILTSITSSGLSSASVPVQNLLRTLNQEHEVPNHIALQVMEWFGPVSGGSGVGGKWKMDAKQVVRQVGIGVLSTHRDEPIAESAFLAEWRAKVGDAFEDWVELSLLLGNYLPSNPPQPPAVLYFPLASLSPVVTQRFSDLFLTRPKWCAQDLMPFLQDIAIDGKERDKMLLKYCRSMTDATGCVWYTSKLKF